jgi:hypothetical protein
MHSYPYGFFSSRLTAYTQSNITNPVEDEYPFQIRSPSLPYHWLGLKGLKSGMPSA